MANFLDTIKLKTGLQAQSNRFDLSSTNLTTLAFNALKPIYAKELMPKEKISIDLENFTRLAPMVNPILSQCRIVTRAFFVPFRTTWAPFNNFLTQTRYTNKNGVPSVIDKTPYFTNQDIIDCFFQVYPSEGNVYIYVREVTGSSAEAKRSASDFFYNNKYWRFTNEGAWAYDLLLNLGYNVSFVQQASLFEEIRFNALPLLCYIKIMLDWYRNPQYDTFLTLEKFLNFDDANHVTATDLNQILNPRFIQYASDYFTTAYDNPLGPNQASNVQFTMNDNQQHDGSTNYQLVVKNNSNGAAAIGTSNERQNSIQEITDNELHWLHRVANYLERLRFSGSRLVDRYLSEFGIKLNNAVTNRSTYLGKNTFNVQVGDVYQTATNTDNQNGLGDYAGKGIAYGQGKFEYQTEEFGYLIITAYVEPRASVAQGVDRSTLRMTPFDFFRGDFDNLGYQAIAQSELFNDYKGDNFATFYARTAFAPNQPFAYTSRYADYKIGRDRLTGNFRLISRNKDLSTWHLYRLIQPTNTASGYASIPSDIGKFKHSLDFTTAKTEPYARIFANENLDFDSFYSLFNFNVISYMPCKPLYEQFHFEDSDGAEVTVHNNGTVLND